jgi:hypothetical protein
MELIDLIEKCSARCEEKVARLRVVEKELAALNKINTQSEEGSKLRAEKNRLHGEIYTLNWVRIEAKN